MIGDSWMINLAAVLQEKLGRDSKKRRSYSPTSVVDLLRFLRNTAHHYHTLGPEVKFALGPMDELGNFWVSTFPLLLPGVYAAMKPFRRDTNCSRISGFYFD